MAHGERLHFRWLFCLHCSLSVAVLDHSTHKQQTKACKDSHHERFALLFRLLCYLREVAEDFFILLKLLEDILERELAVAGGSVLD